MMKNLWFISGNKSSKRSSGHLDCIFDSIAENLWSKLRNVFAQSTKMTKSFNLFKKLFFLKIFPNYKLAKKFPSKFRHFFYKKSPKKMKRNVAFSKNQSSKPSFGDVKSSLDKPAGNFQQKTPKFFFQSLKTIKHYDFPRKKFLKTFIWTCRMQF